MFEEETGRLYDYIKSFHESKNYGETLNEIDCTYLIPQLRIYQENAVKWMLYKEFNLDEDVLPKNYDGCPVSFPSGGILADEMGLGKTVEMLALVLNNPCQNIEEIIETEEEKADNLDTNEESESEPSSTHSSTSDDSSESDSSDDIPLALRISEKVSNRKSRCYAKKIYTQRDSIDDDNSSFEEVKKVDDSDEDYVPENNTSRRNYVTIVSDDSDEEFTLSSVRRKRHRNKRDGRKSSKRRKFDDLILKKSGKEKSGLASDKYTALRAWYGQQLSGLSFTSSQNKLSGKRKKKQIKCYCSGIFDAEKIQCRGCRTWQHKKCVGLETYSVKSYYCPQCWSKKQVIPSAATFIVSPDSIVHQWQDEIKRHVKKGGLKVLYYAGAKGGHYVQPRELADQDIVITTYSVLCSELNYCDTNTPVRQLRYDKRFHAVTTPLTCVAWWRLCLDEAQMVEGSTTRTAAMCHQLISTHKWAITGTPFQKSINDLFGLMCFLKVEPFTNYKVWSSLVAQESTLHEFVGHLMWRSRKQDVLAMLGVPPQKVNSHWLKFSPVEGFFYQRTHSECSAAFFHKISSFIGGRRTSVDRDMDVTLASLDRTFVNSLMTPLLSVRQACTHPQAVRGKFLKFKKTMTMEELLTAMVKRVRRELDGSVRTLVASLNGQAGIRLLLGEWREAVLLYRQVLQLPSSHPNQYIKVDTLQKLHTLHNLADVLRDYETLEKALRDDDLQSDALEMERKYINKYHDIRENAKKQMVMHQGAVDEKLGRSTLGYSNWWQNVISSCDDTRELVDRVKSNVLDNVSKFPVKGHYSTRIKNINSLLGELATWIADSDNARIAALKELKLVEVLDPLQLSQQALACHLRGTDKSVKSKCKLCVCEKKLLAYETLIFAKRKEEESRKRNRNCETRVIDEDEDSDKDGARRGGELAELQGVSLHSTKKEGNWKPGQMETILQVLLAFAKQKKLPQEWLTDGTNHLALFEAVRREFKSLRDFWRSIFDQVAAHDELNMAKMRFRLPLPEEIKLIQKKKIKESYIMQPHEIAAQLERFSNEKIVAERDVTRNIGILMYLTNLQKNPDSERDPCPICREQLTEKWAVLKCGHCFCFDCIPSLMKANTSVKIECAICRGKTHKADIAYVDCSQINLNSEYPVKGSHSTKIEAVVIKTLQIKRDSPNDKILVFSSWEKVLDVVGEAFEINDISFQRLVSDKNKAKKILSDFKTIEDVTALLIPLKLGSKGLNLVEANHVFLVEPILNPSEELQAVGRVHRIGQLKETFVHRFVIRDTIEERMLTSLESGSAKWASQKVTLRMLYDLFAVPVENITEERTHD